MRQARVPRAPSQLSLHRGPREQLVGEVHYRVREEERELPHHAHVDLLLPRAAKQEFVAVDHQPVAFEVRGRRRARGGPGSAAGAGPKPVQAAVPAATPTAAPPAGAPPPEVAVRVGLPRSARGVPRVVCVRLARRAAVRLPCRPCRPGPRAARRRPPIPPASTLAAYDAPARRRPLPLRLAGRLGPWPRRLGPCPRRRPFHARAGVRRRVAAAP